MSFCHEVKQNDSMLIAVTDDGKYTFVSIYSATQSSALTRENLPNRTQHAFSPYRTNVYLKCNSPQYPPAQA